MIIVMNKDVTDDQIGVVVKKLKDAGLDANISRGIERTVIGAIGDERKLTEEMFTPLPGVESAMHIVKQYKIVSRESHRENTVIDIGGIQLGGKQIQIIAGPCSVETQQQMDLSAQYVSEAGCRLMRGGAFKPRTSPYTFQGKGVEGLDMFRQAASKFKLPIVTELMDVRMLDTFLENDVDVIQIGTRNMQNFDLLKEVGRINKPVILKRGMSATISEWLMAAEYIAAGGNHNIIFCERGIRTFETYYRNVLDVTAIPVMKKETHLPIIVDPSHAGGKAWMVAALSQAAIAAGADGLLVEMHPNPSEAWCDADQALTPQELKKLMGVLGGIATAIGRTL
ncbi:MAG: 3-deoxy-7-phosphoheptulonate synthase [Candidatus Nitrotoga sp.]|nr:3-deoxy-7-phosphoheptulonate synthase [Candidatus Nitrotoga sp.]RFC34169.1 MAG: 3-deoxy-D-arabinoheptulosonate-7-phosphate synthase [Candidatus Nitrotoga sp. MKT]RFC39415.1 MAG: 3-deoxy-D-arabinoheptulosonate-7-phosphate synthase [Candidatus Nitrotoga sp. LAW]RFC41350.1 MAG: 3-deoxy-D-arabinoheptulosonate-7-phosphate synthase [Candidatus Nitrotoga sp. CP45]MDO9448512.1 3-deoxy-7-phosphoheptulonate synthase [Candidatus Nitrotoga sp.]